MQDLLFGMLAGSLALVLGLGVVLFGKDGYKEGSYSSDCERENVWMPKEETIIVDGCQIIIRYPDETNPEAMKQIRTLLEKQRIEPKSAPLFDDHRKK